MKLSTTEFHAPRLVIVRDRHLYHSKAPMRTYVWQHESEIDRRTEQKDDDGGSILRQRGGTCCGNEKESIKSVSHLAS